MVTSNKGTVVDLIQYIRSLGRYKNKCNKQHESKYTKTPYINCRNKSDLILTKKRIKNQTIQLKKKKKKSFETLSF